MGTIRRLDWLIIGVFFLVLSRFIKPFLLIDFVIFCIYVLAYDLLYGYMGRLSFGHMLYLGTGAYAAALSAVHISSNPLISVMVALVAGAAIGTILGPMTIRLKGAPFALVNLAFNSMGYFLVLSVFDEHTGGEDGLAVMFSQVGPLNSYDLNSMFIFSLLCMIVVFVLIKILVSSPYGILLRTIKENETRVKFLGYNTFVYKWVAFLLSTSIAAVAGALYTINLSYVSPSLMDPRRNVEVVFATLIGGAGTLYGAIVGGSLYVALSNYLSSYISRWEMFLGIALLLVVFRFPEGVVGYMKKTGNTLARLELKKQ